METEKKPVSQHTRDMWEIRVKQAVSAMVVAGKWDAKVARDFLNLAMTYGPPVQEGYWDRVEREVAEERAEAVAQEFHTAERYAPGEDGGATVLNMATGEERPWVPGSIPDGFDVQPPQPCITLAMPTMEHGDIVTVFYGEGQASFYKHRPYRKPYVQPKPTPAQASDD